MKRNLVFLFWLLPFISFGQVVLYSECSYRGKATILGPGNFYSSYSGNANGSVIRSAKVPTGFRVELFADKEMMQKPAIITSNNSCLTNQVPTYVQAVRITYSNDAGFGNANSQEGVLIYTSCQYQGRSAFLPPGNYPNLKNVIGNYPLSSFKVPDGMVLELFEFDDFRGSSSGKITGTNPCISGSWNNRASSVKVYFASSGGYIPPEETLPYDPSNANISIYTGCNYQGKSFTFDAGNIPYLKQNLDYQMPASMRIPKGMTVTLYSTTNYGGTVLGNFTENNPCLSYTAQTKAQSMRVTGYPTSATYPPPGSGGSSYAISLYTNCNFTGKSIALTEGRYASVANIGNVYASSIRIPKGYAVTLFLGKNFTGTSSGRITSTIECLGTTFRQRFQSIIVEQWDDITYPPPNSGDAVIIYSRCNYSGNSVKLGQGNFASISNLNYVSPASLQIPSGYVVTLFTGKNYTGTSTGKLTSDLDCLGSAFNNGQVQSLTVERTNSSDAVVVYSGCNYSGYSVKLGKGDFASIANINNVSPASLQIPAGYVVTLFTGKNFTGISSGKITSNNTCLGSVFKGRVQSLTVERTNGGNDVNIFSGCYYSGNSVKLGLGNYANTSSINYLSTASLQIPQGYIVTLYTGTNFTGISSGKITSDLDCLGTAFKGKVQSLTVEQTTGGGTYPPTTGNIGIVYFYNSCNYGGSSRQVSQGAYANISSIGLSPSSLRIPKDWEVILFTGPNFTGNSSGTLTSNNSCLNTTFRGKAKSAIINYVGITPPPR